MKKGVFFILLLFWGWKAWTLEIRREEEEGREKNPLSLDRVWNIEVKDTFTLSFNFPLSKYHFRRIPCELEEPFLSQREFHPSLRKPLEIGVIHPFRLGLLGTATLGTGLVLNDYYESIWWEGKPQKFHFKNDFGTLRFSDKLGHAYIGLLITELYTPLFRWSCMSPGNARWGGVATSLLHQILFVEYQDGFAEWGFSLSDVSADLVGAFYPLLQDRSPLLDHFDWKWSYHPSLHSWGDYLNWNTLLNDLYDNAFHMDYNGMTFWLTGELHPLLPPWPEFLNLALGYGTEGMDINKGGSGSSEIFLSLDYAIEKLRGEGKVWKGAKSILKILHLPAPAIRITPDAKFYLFYF